LRWVEPTSASIDDGRPVPLPEPVPDPEPLPPPPSVRVPRPESLPPPFRVDAPPPPPDDLAPLAPEPRAPPIDLPLTPTANGKEREASKELTRADPVMGKTAMAPPPAKNPAGPIFGWTAVIAVVAAGAWWWGGWHGLLAVAWIVIFAVIWGQMTEAHSNPIAYWIVFPVVTAVALGLWNWLAKPELRYDTCIPNPFARVTVCTTSPFIRPSQPGKP
jgi:hypothetical protein